MKSFKIAALTIGILICFSVCGQSAKADNDSSAADGVEKKVVSFSIAQKENTVEISSANAKSGLSCVKIIDFKGALKVKEDLEEVQTYAIDTKNLKAGKYWLLAYSSGNRVTTQLLTIH